MGKLLRFLDNNIVKLGVAFLIVFTALYPKIPSVHIIRTYVYIRLEDFFIATVVAIWVIQIIRRKERLPSFFASLPIYVYWFVGLACLFFSLYIFGPQAPNFFPHIAALEYLRRIEYMILFFVAFSTVKNKKDVKDYFVVLCITVLAIALYGIGQKFYGILWVNFPAIKQSGFCFPSFQTGNEEFAKGFRLCLPSDGRITSTFGGSYDLAAYMVFLIPILVTVLVTLKKWSLRISVALLAIFALMMLIFTASRVSFISYIFGITAALVLFKKKWFLIPVIVVSVILLLLFSSSTIKRFEQTIRFTSIVTTDQGEVVGEVSTTTVKGKTVKAITPSQNLQSGSVTIGLPTKAHATSSATIQHSLTEEQARALRLQNGGYSLSNVKGSFLIQKALTLDISFTTRFQAEWPRAWAAFLKDPFLGTGYSTLTLATDGDYLRFLGESGLLGFLSFFSIFLIFGIILFATYKEITSPFHRALAMGTAGGLIGIFVNAIFIDVFEASKVAENLWIILGIVLGMLFLYQKKPIPYVQKIKEFVYSTPINIVYLFTITIIVLISCINNFFVADDFTWLYWVANIDFSGILKFFTDAVNFFYRPIDKTIMFGLYTIFSFNPQGYRLFIFILHFLSSIAVFFIANKLLKKKLYAFASSAIFLLLPSQAENLYWISTISATTSTVFILYGILSYFKFTEKNSYFFYILSILFGLLALFSYEMCVIYPLLVILVDLYHQNYKFSIQRAFLYIPFVLLIPFYYVVRLATHAFFGGGDYSFSIIHFVPNVIGNSIGYLGLLLFGEQFISVNNSLRDSFKSEMMVVLMGILVLIGLIIYGFLFQKKRIYSFAQKSYGKIVIFCLAFMFISILPFAGLGNISERYSYLASVSFCILLVLLITKIVGLFAKAKVAKWIFVAIIVLLSSYYYYQLQAISSEWQHAGTITQDTMAFFRLEYPHLTKNDTVYLVNVPIKYKNAWVYPLGVSDNLWFVYRDNMPQIHQVNSETEAKMLTNYTYNTKGSNNYLFDFGSDEYIYKVK